MDLIGPPQAIIGPKINQPRLASAGPDAPSEARGADRCGVGALHCRYRDRRRVGVGLERLRAARPWRPPGPLHAPTAAGSRTPSKNLYPGIVSAAVRYRIRPKSVPFQNCICIPVSFPHQHLYSVVVSSPNVYGLYRPANPAFRLGKSLAANPCEAVVGSEWAEQ